MVRIAITPVAVLFVGIALSAEPPAAKRPANRLVRESSPYLLQHAHNPVDWFPWGPEAFAKAQKENKLVFLSIGYSSCHWCHVMERESFENADIAKTLNQSFVCIKVDREERPDIDQIYLTALQVFGLNGGWPLSMFLTPDGKPIIGGTYWPPDDKLIGSDTVRGFKSVLKTILDLEKEKPQELRTQADKVAELTRVNLGRSAESALAPALTRALIDVPVEALRSEFDAQYGGFGSAEKNYRGPKFPTPPSLELLWQVGAKQPDLRKLVTKTLDAMARGGICDQLGGGFHRYSTERTWTVPHFEKMLYDNAQLAELYSRAFAATKDPLYKQVVQDTLEFVRRDLTSPDGAFYSALDADSEDDEGKTYVWTVNEVASVLANPAKLDQAKQAFGLTGAANFEGKAYVLTRPASAKADVGEIRGKLLAARARRPQPFRDTKVIASWNGQMIAGYAVAAQEVGDAACLDAAIRAADFVLKNMRTRDGRLLRTFAAVPGQPAQARGPAFLDDYAYFVHGLLALHDSTSADKWLNEAKALTAIMLQYHGDEAGGFFYTPSDHEKLFARAKDQFDGAQPSGNTVAIRNLLRLATKTGDANYRNLAEKALKSFAAALEQRPTGMMGMAAVLDQFLEVAAPVQLQPPPAAGGGAKKSDNVVKAKAETQKPGADGKQVVKITLSIDKGWHLYANPVGNDDLASAQTVVKIEAKTKPTSVKIDYPKSKLIKDKLVGDYSVFEGEIVVTATVERARGDASPLEISIKIQACNDSTCLLPATIKLSVP